MSLPSLVPTFDLEMFEGYSFENGFQIEYVNPDGTSQVPPVYEDFTSSTKNAVMIVSEIFGKVDLSLSTADVANANGSQLSKSGTPTDGVLSLLLSQTEMAANKIITGVGYWRLVIIETGLADRVMMRGTVTIVPFNAEGAI